MAKVTGPSTSDLVKVFHDSLVYEIVRAFGVPDDRDAPYLRRLEVAEAVNVSRYAHARCLWEFFTSTNSPRKKPDDVCSQDYGFPPVAKPASVLEEAHKGIFHLTSTRVQAARPKPWTDAIVRDLLPHAVAFMEHILANEATVCGGNLFATPEARMIWQDLLGRLRACNGGAQRLVFRCGTGSQADRVWFHLDLTPGDFAALAGCDAEPPPADAVCVQTTANTTVEIRTFTME